jgi:hypothetical protein
VVPPKPKVYYKRDQNKDRDVKKKKKHINTKSKKINKADKYEQSSPEIITLQHFILKEDWEKLTLGQKRGHIDEEINKSESEEIWGESCNMVYSSNDEDMPTLEEIFSQSNQREASTSGTKREECKATLRFGTNIPERQVPKDSNKGKDKAQNKNNEVECPNKNPEKTRQTVEEYNVLAHLRKIPTLLSIFDALMMSQELREVLIQALQDPEKYKSYFIEQNMQRDLVRRQTGDLYKLHRR